MAARSRLTCGYGPHAKIGSYTEHLRIEPPMDAEQINAIGSTLSDLQARTADLRRYL